MGRIHVARTQRKAQVRSVGRPGSVLLDRGTLEGHLAACRDLPLRRMRLRPRLRRPGNAGTLNRQRRPRNAHQQHRQRYCRQLIASPPHGCTPTTSLMFEPNRWAEVYCLSSAIIDPTSERTQTAFANRLLFKIGAPAFSPCTSGQLSVTTFPSFALLILPAPGC